MERAKVIRCLSCFKEISSLEYTVVLDNSYGLFLFYLCSEECKRTLPRVLGGHINGF